MASLKRWLFDPQTPADDLRGGALTGVAERQPCSIDELPGRRPRRARVLERPLVVVDEHLGVVLGPPERLHPFGGAAVLLRPAGARYLAVRDVPHEQVEEPVFRLVGHGRATLAADELLALEPVEMVLGHRSLELANVGRRP